MPPNHLHEPDPAGLAGAAKVVAVCATQPSPLEAGKQSSAFDGLVRQWSVALNAAQIALRSAGHYLGAQELAEHSKRFSQERSGVVRLLQRLGHDWQTDSPLLDGLLDSAA